jgi:5-methylcytosine-specific restriction endonuclease McrA
MATRVPRTRASNTMTEAQYWGFVRSGLRSKSRFWKPIHEAKLLARRDSQSDNKRLKYEYQCAICKKWFPEKEIEVDHIVPTGSLRSGDDLKPFVANLFCEVEGLRTLCEPCHAIVTKEQKDANRSIPNT